MVTNSINVTFVLSYILYYKQVVYVETIHVSISKLNRMLMKNKNGHLVFSMGIGDK